MCAGGMRAVRRAAVPVVPAGAAGALPHRLALAGPGGAAVLRQGHAVGHGGGAGPRGAAAGRRRVQRRPRRHPLLGRRARRRRLPAVGPAPVAPRTHRQRLLRRQRRAQGAVRLGERGPFPGVVLGRAGGARGGRDAGGAERVRPADAARVQGAAAGGACPSQSGAQDGPG
jgi:hypothetical protein